MIVAIAPRIGGGEDVVGVAAAVDLNLEGDPADADNDVSGLCLFYSLLAVDVRVQSPAVVTALLDELELARDRIYARRKDYIGEIALPLPGGPAGLKRYLSTHAFRQLRHVWCRPRNAVDPDWER